MLSVMGLAGHCSCSSLWRMREAPIRQNSSIKSLNRSCVSVGLGAWSLARPKLLFISWRCWHKRRLYLRGVTDDSQDA
eukprot:6208215-Pleurochrysis_carterae.AAC.1